MWAVWFKQQAIGQAWDWKGASGQVLLAPRLANLSFLHLDPIHGD